MSPEPSRNVKVLTIGAICLLSVIFLSLSFVGRYFEQRAIVAALVPALVSDNPRVAQSALDVLKETVSPARHRRFERLVQRRFADVVATKWDEDRLLPSTLRDLELEIERISSVSPKWSREMMLLERARRQKAFKQLDLMVRREQDEAPEGFAAAMEEVHARLKDRDCAGARRSLEKAARGHDRSRAVRHGQHMTLLCEIAASLRESPESRVAKAPAVTAIP